MRRIIIFLAGIIASASICFAQSGVTTIDKTVQIDKMVHDFGDILTDSGPQKAIFTVKNISSSPIAISSVISSCGCTDVVWTRKPLSPGQTGTIEAVYSNDQGAIPFDKTLTVYISSLKKPLVLHLRGTVMEKKLPLAQLYLVRRGSLGFKENEINVGNLTQGNQKSTEVLVANLGTGRSTIKFTQLSEGLEVGSVTVLPGEVGKISATVTASEERWGRNIYSAVPVIDGIKYQPLTFRAFTAGDFSAVSDSERACAPVPEFDASDFSFGLVKAGGLVDIVFKVRNTGKNDLIVYKADVDDSAVSVIKNIPVLKPGEEGRLHLRYDTKNQPLGEKLMIVTLVTNSPVRPLPNLFISGALK